MRRLLALVLPLVASVGMLPAGAAPLQTSRLAEVNIELPAGGAARVHITLDAVSGDAGDRLSASVVTCTRTCGPTRFFSGRLPAGALNIDPQQASGRLATSLGGLALQISWVPQLGAGVERGYVDGGNGTDVSAGSYRGEDAVAAVRVPSGGCQGRATVGTQVDANLSGTSARVEPLSRLRLPTAGRPTCTG